MNTDSLDLLIIAAHPDDAEIALGGTILRGMGSKKSAKDWWTVAFEDDSNLGVSLRVTRLCLLCLVLCR